MEHIEERRVSVEEKARAYDEAIGKLRGMMPNWERLSYNGKTFLQDLIYIFPELKESGDERIRKALIRYFTLSDEHAYNEACGVSYKDILAWLEKRGQEPEKVSIWKHWKDGIAGNEGEKLIYLVKGDDTYRLTSCLAFECDYIELSELDSLMFEKQGEQKPDDLKTKAGNWYVCDMEVMNENMVTAFHRNEIYYCPKDGYLDVRGALFEVGCLDVFRLATEKEIPQTKQEWSEEDEKMLKRLCRIVHSQRVEKVITLKEESELGKCMDKWLNHNPQPHWKPSELQIEALAIAIRCGIKLGTWEEEALKDLIEQLKRLREE